MNWVHIHLMTNHVPVIGIVIGVILLVVTLAWKSPDLRRFALYYFVALGAATLLVYLTGEPAEEAIEHAPGISEAVIERHEKASVYGLIAVELLAALSLAGLLAKRSALATRPVFTRALLGVALLAAVILGWVANLGGKIRHTELDAGIQSAGVLGDDED
ncbi:MAG: hypothetical protein NDJ89_12685 [Oligoflexia bacterium]|nr:hypothetical protein [Oligoflexia bacterium]